jgi:hypothetical protein
MRGRASQGSRFVWIRFTQRIIAVKGALPNGAAAFSDIIQREIRHTLVTNELFPEDFHGF